jgi:hypothetical protein
MQRSCFSLPKAALIGASMLRPRFLILLPAALEQCELEAVFDPQSASADKPNSRGVISSHENPLRMAALKQAEQVD